MFDSKGAITNTIEKGSRFQIKMKLLFHEEIQDPIGAYTFKDTRGTEITGTNTMFEKAYIRPPKAGETCVITFEQKMDLQGGEYLIPLDVPGIETEIFTCSTVSMMPVISPWCPRRTRWAFMI